MVILFRLFIMSISTTSIPSLKRSLKEVKRHLKDTRFTNMNLIYPRHKAGQAYEQMQETQLLAAAEGKDFSDLTNNVNRVKKLQQRLFSIPFITIPTSLGIQAAIIANPETVRKAQLTSMGAALTPLIALVAVGIHAAIQTHRTADDAIKQINIYTDNI